MKFNSKLILFVLCLVGLIALQVKVIMPVVYDVVSSDLFLENNESDAVLESMSDQMLGHAFDQCNNYIANDLDPDEITATFVNEPTNAWEIEAGQYVITADIDLIPSDAPAFTRRYVCRIEYTSDSPELTEITNADNWSVDGLSGLDDI